MHNLTTDGVHHSIGLDEPGRVNFMSFPLGFDRAGECLPETGIVGTSSQKLAKVGLINRKKAVAQLAVGGDTDAVARPAERMRD